ncbi:bile acid:sodium symporter family protein [Streptomyces sp. HNM0574]|uniref:bile acid:sodium symporter family protein n=1 Tax=Streptomyces sp. HNM0574 TaxID=2714954 RepID=UPI00146B0A51|nr:bile acid:sodium symporter family protein [Streptomyces sp. HNM0574]NLU68788.1 bile acid:sodium symporter family protein [Streptomyces sp. HNM0574]
MNSPFISAFLPIAVALVMVGLGLSLTVQDFIAVRTHRRAVAVTMALQLVVLPALCFGLMLVLQVPSVLAAGMMLLAASPGGTISSLFSHLFGGDVALNITLTAANSVIAIVSIPLVTNLGLAYFDPDLGGGQVTLQFGKMLQVFAIVLVPVAVGMLLRRYRPSLAAALDRPVRIGSSVVLALAVLGSIFSERAELPGYIADVGPAVLVFCALNLVLGFAVPRAVRVARPQAIAASFEIGAHNATLAITIAVGVLDSSALAVPAAVYGAFMIPVAALFGRLLARTGKPTSAAVGHAG